MSQAPSDPKTTSEVYCEVYIAAGPHEALVGTYKTGLMPEAAGVAAVADMSALGLSGDQLSSFGPDARAVAANCRRSDNHAIVASSPWMSQIDWTQEPPNGQPKGRP